MKVQPAEPAVTAKPKHRWYQFSLRTLLLLVTLSATATGFGLWLRHRAFCLDMAAEYAEEQKNMGTSVMVVEGNETESELEALQAAGRLKDENRLRNSLRMEQAYRRAIWRPWEPRPTP
jgi:hypothetical protein